MQYSPKLKKVAEEIKEILKREDINAIVCLAHETHAEYVFEISNNGSCASWDEITGELRVKALRADFNSQKEQLETIKRTADHVMGLNKVLNMGRDLLNHIYIMMRKKVEIGEDNNGPGTSHTAQNN